MDTLSFLKGFRFIDSFFPSGGFAFSSGLEAAVQGGAVHNAEEFSAYVMDQLRHSLGRREAVTVGMAWEAAAIGAVDRVVWIDQQLESMKLGLDSRRASRQMGRQVARVAGEHSGDRLLLRDYLSAVESDTTPGHLPVALGLTLQAAGWGKADSIAGFLYQTLVGYNSAALKLLPIGQRESQRLLNEWIPLVSEISREAAASENLSSWSPVQDIYAMRHSRLESRLFRS